MAILIRHKIKFLLLALFLAAGTAFALLSMGGPVASQEQPAPESSWIVRCQEAGAARCEIFQRLIVQETGQRVAEFAIGFPEDKGAARGVVVLPLGILLTDGVQMQIDEHQPFSFKVRFCTADGCYAYLNLNETVLDLMRKGGKAVLSFRSLQGQNVEIPISLTGFTRSLAEIS